MKILAHLRTNQKASRDMTGGILHYAAVHDDIQVQIYGFDTPRPSLEEFRTWAPDGAILGTINPKTVRKLEDIGCMAAVFINTDPPAKTHLKCASVFCDNTSIANAAADLFENKRLRHLAYVGTRELDEWSLERARTMRRRARASGCTFSEFVSPDTAKYNQTRELAALAEWLGRLPKPCGVFAANDLRAKDVLDSARLANLAIPGQIMVLGVDNEDFVCVQMKPTLSSIIPDFTHGGYIAMQTLVELVKGTKKSLSRRTFGCQGIIERISTCDPNGSGQMVSKANEFIRLYAADRRVSVADVAKAAGASLRLLQMNYKTVTGSTISDAIQSVRLKKVCELLEQTETPINHIGELCGFQSETYLKKLFRSRFGCTMRAWRNNPR